MNYFLLKKYVKPCIWAFLGILSWHTIFRISIIHSLPIYFNLNINYYPIYN